MKKKVLTTAAALAMLAPTAAAFATTVTEDTVGGKDSQKLNSNLTIEGSVQTSTGTAPEGQISVTLPTAISFVVDQNGDVIAPTGMSITNKSNVAIDITIESFTDSNPGAGIELVDTNNPTVDLTTLNRSNVELALSVTGATSGASSGSTVKLLHSMAKTNFASIDANGTAGLALVGQAGTDADVNGVDATGTTDKFTLVFGISKKNSSVIVP